MATPNYCGRYPKTMEYLKHLWNRDSINTALLTTFIYYYRRGDNGQCFDGLYPFGMNAEDVYYSFDGIIEGEQKIRDGITNLKSRDFNLTELVEVKSEPPFLWEYNPDCI